MSSPTDKSPAELLATPTQFLKGVGPDRAKMLQRLGLRTARDVLFFFPRDYQDLSERRTIARIDPDKPVSIVGTVVEIDFRSSSPGRSIVGVLIRDDTDYARAVWYNQPFMRDKFERGDRVMLSGTPKRNAFRWEFAHPKIEVLREGDQPPTGRILPVYPLTEGVSQHQVRRVTEYVVENFTSALEEVFPGEFLDRHDLWPIHAALPQVHFPHDRASLEQARRRFIYQELLVMQLALAMKRRRLTLDRQAPSLEASAKIDARITRLFPFDLTEAQRTAIDEVSGDMGRSYPMNRLLHGDVGSGKTVVAEYAMLLTVAHQHQAAIMAPTEVLARQHERTLRKDLAGGRVRVERITGGQTAAERRAALAAIESGEADIVVGTQALVQSEVRFARLGLVVIDEQHKFGVSQRAGLKQSAEGSGMEPHYLVMTATPIPRTMSMTLYGDLDVSTLREAPPGRQAVHTYLGDDAKRERWWEFYRKKLREGRQGYVITPLVESSELFSGDGVQEAFEALANGELADFKLDLVHGRMSAEGKQAAMENFHAGETDVLVATSVVEVGVDVPNAVMMTIESGERFGLAQLHQLRGRISRGSHPGFVCVFGDPTTDAARKRLDAFTATNDGFELAEVDFQLRGPGDLFGTRQHGLPPLRIADVQRDEEHLETARKDAKQMIAEDADLSNPEFEKLRRMVLARYGAALDIGDVG